MADSTFIFSGPSAVSRSLFNVNNRRNFRTALAKRTDDSTATKSNQENQFEFPSLRVPNPLVARFVVSVLGLGFVDAGYSGDWSRIGAITKESEDLLKIGAFLVVPFCVFLISSFAKQTDSS
ncbi:uncharacterized protein LOC111007301 [Momordica charantia]|uniref:Uncharacterized protein LOC111007301 n=1 Tax=Momordica charantia TaxID=3673 RepID=A0A6J1C0R6_MOMCH|nr:uncharacterized protein LOC111007301 [Momordica charantia]